MEEKYQTKEDKDWEKIMDEQDKNLKVIRIAPIDKRKERPTNEEYQNILLRKYNGSD